MPRLNNTLFGFNSVSALVSVSMLGIFAAITAGVLLSAFVISRIWDWYVTSFLHAPMMPMVTAFGLSVLVTYMVPSRKTNKDDNSWSWLWSGLGALFVAWIGTLFM